MDQHQLFHPGGLSHAARSGGAALARVLPVGVHYRLVVPAHADHHVRAPRQFRHCVAGLGVAGENYAPFRRIHPVGQGIQPGLDVLGGGGGYFPVRAAEHLAGPHVPSVHRRRRPGQDAAPVDENVLAQGVVDPRLPVVGEQAVFAQDALGYPLGQVGAEDLELVLFADALVPAAKQEAGVVDVMVKVMVGEEEVVHLGGKQPRLDQLVGGSRPAVEHQQLLAQLQYVGTAEAGRRGGRGAGSQGVDFSHPVYLENLKVG